MICNGSETQTILSAGGLKCLKGGTGLRVLSAEIFILGRKKGWTHSQMHSSSSLEGLFFGRASSLDKCLAWF